MKRYAFSLRVFFLAALILGLSLCLGVNLVFSQEEGSAKGVRVSEEQLRPVLEVQEGNEDKLFGIPGVVAVGTGLAEKGGGLAIHVYFNNRDVPGASRAAIPQRVDSIPVRILETDEIKALDDPPGDDHRLIYPLPVPMGVSTGNDNGCFAGTLGYRVFRRGQSSKVGYISNAHIASAGGTKLCPGLAAFGEDQFQPGLPDSDCSPVLPKIGDLVQYVPIVFGSSFENTVDAAFVASSRDLVDKSILDIGNPSPNTVLPAVGQSVQKSGSGSGYTTGTITTINTTVDVNYGSGCGKARFVGQIAITPGSFSAPGDSGSPVLTFLTDSSGRFKPVGLLFAGSSTTTFANRISDVLGALGSVIDTQ